MMAMRDLAGGGIEITFDYAMVMHPSDESTTYFKIPCLCGAKDCRGFIAEDDWQRPELQKRYDGWFQWFLQEKIEKQRR
jgi:hypothetical protein